MLTHCLSKPVPNFWTTIRDLLYSIRLNLWFITEDFSVTINLCLILLLYPFFICCFVVGHSSAWGTCLCQYQQFGPSYLFRLLLWRMEAFQKASSSPYETVIWDITSQVWWGTFQRCSSAPIKSTGSLQDCSIPNRYTVPSEILSYSHSLPLNGLRLDLLYCFCLTESRDCSETRHPWGAVPVTLGCVWHSLRYRWTTELSCPL